jgi:hypothetical protein
LILQPSVVIAMRIGLNNLHEAKAIVA